MALTLSSPFRRKSPALLGVDISTSSVKLVELSEGSRTRMRLERYAIESLERGAVVDGNIVVTKGLDEGELVATAGSFKLREGLLVPLDAPAGAPGPAAMN
ncbi:MAG: pilus assembly protein PilM, partial [Burkholderiales bacterium]